MKRNPNTRNIFTAEGRLNRRIDKYNKTLALINKMDEILKRFEAKVDNNMGIPIDEINENIIINFSFKSFKNFIHFIN